MTKTAVKTLNFSYVIKKGYIGLNMYNAVKGKHIFAEKKRKKKNFCMQVSNS